MYMYMACDLRDLTFSQSMVFKCGLGLATIRNRKESSKKYSV